MDRTSLAPYVRIHGRGPGRARSFTLDEAQEAMALVLSGEMAPEAVGGLLMLMRYRGEAPEEIAGFVKALREELPEWDGPRPSLDWPSYAAGRTRGVPWFLLAAKLVGRAGHTVLVHGWNSHQSEVASVRNALDIVGIANADWVEAPDILARDGVVYLRVEEFAPKLLELIRLRDVLGVRSCMNTVARVLNPGHAAAAVQGVFHPPYRELQAAAGKVLGQDNLTIIKGGGGEFERHPSKDIQLYGLRKGAEWQPTLAPLIDDTRRLNEAEHTPQALADLWNGTLDDPFAEAIVIGTAALALDTLGEPDPERRARALWEARR